MDANGLFGAGLVPARRGWCGRRGGIGAVVVAILLAGCSKDAAPAPGTATRVTALAAGAACAAGGSRIELGPDADGDGILDDAEVAQSVVVCHGVDGLPGAAAEPCALTDHGDGSITVACPGSAPVTLRDGAAGADAVPCTATAGGDGSVTVSCPGSAPVVVAGGRDGTSAHATLALVEPATADQCPAGGQVLTVGLDDGGGQGVADDGLLQLGERDGASLLCLPACGDGAIQAALGEQCDDGNAVAGDGCGAGCHLEPVCTGPTPDPACPGLPYFVDRRTPGALPTQGGVPVVLEGAFPPDVTADQVAVVFLPTGAPLAVLSASGSAITVGPVPRGPLAGAGLVVVVQGRLVPWLSPEVGPAGEPLVVERATVPLDWQPPVVQVARGCVGDTATQAVDCPISGGLLQVLGANFGRDAAALEVRVGTALCGAPVVLASDTMLRCELPPRPEGGYDLPVTVTVDGRSGTGAGVSYFGPIILPGIRLGGGPVVEAAVADGTFGAQAVELTGPFMDLVTSVRYGTGNTWYPCAIFDRTGGTLGCSLDPGVGRDLRFVVQIGLLASRPSAATISYPAPVLLPATLGLTAGERSAAAVLTGPGRVHLDVRFLATAGPLPLVTYSDGLTAHPCEEVALFPLAADTFRVSCAPTVPTAGPARLTVSALNQASAEGTDLLTFGPDPVTPVLAGLSGCVDAGSATGDCPTAGGTAMTATLAAAPTAVASIEVNGLAVATTSLGPTSLGFAMPPGARAATVVAVVDGLRSAPLAVTYAAPLIDAVRGCTDVGAVTVACPPAGGLLLTVQGRHLGAAGAVVLVGGQPCAPVVHDPEQPHARLTCALPAGAGLSRPVYLSNGRMSAVPGELSYAP